MEMSTAGEGSPHLWTRRRTLARGPSHGPYRDDHRQLVLAPLPPSPPRLREVRLPAQGCTASRGVDLGFNPALSDSKVYAISTTPGISQS